ncbi:MAG: hypothetical protein CVU62_01115 [Deltaproteobacteria bacterium HGW-Deltaproteobacteria-2]|jgi:hypothetical protein|nr:MAG: hypothetical protein CVU62_01115 [Deltaproteobacteria bacterium HGW-Deltaproteobacteria-2]
MQGGQKAEPRGVYLHTLSGAVCSATQQLSVFQQPTGNILRIIKKAALHFARKEFFRNAINERADLTVLRQKHTLPEKIGIILIVFSFIMVIPSFFIVGLIAADLKKPMVGIIGIPVAYGISWLITMLGMYLTGPRYVKALGRWIAKVVLGKILGDEINTVRSSPIKDSENDINK